MTNFASKNLDIKHVGTSKNCTNVSRETDNTLIKNAIYYGKLIPQSNFHKKLDVKTC